MAKKKNPRISLCMIVKNEEALLPRCLDAAKPFVDEIIVVDTGSTDATIEIARGFGAKVSEYPWNDHFAEARNVALEQATGDWILSLDADEVLSELAGRDLRKAARKSQYIGAYIPLRDRGDSGKETVSLMFRAWRNKPEIRWRYRLHEQVLPDALPFVRDHGMRLAQLSGEIFHDGYRAEIMEAKNKDERNERLYDLQLAESPDDLYVLYKYADFLRQDEDRRHEAMEPLRRAYDAMHQLEDGRRKEFTFTGEICALLALDLQRSDRPDGTLEITRFGIDHCRHTAHLWYAHANSLSFEGEWEEAESAFRECIGYHGRPMHIPPQAHITGAAARKGLVRALAHQTRNEDASEEAWRIAQDYPDDAEALALFVDVSCIAKDLAGVTRRLIERVQQRPLCGNTWFKGGELFFRLRLFEKALPWIMRAAELLEDPGPANGLLGECLLAAGHYEPAIDAFSRGLPDDLRCRAGILLMSLAYNIELAEPLDPADESLRTEVRRMIGNLRELGHDRLQHRLHEAAPQLEETDPVAHRFLEAALG
ncbi:MAG: hypothetical protein CMJ83_02925 [Planctomycetes bacterium]|nr:hypothetical protein [Planctomycetota bacterium]